MIKDKISNHIHKPISGEWGDDCDGINCRNILRTTNFTHLGRVKYDDVVKRAIDETVFQKKRLHKNDIIIEKSGGSDTIAVGRVVFFDLDADDYTCNNFTSIVRCKETIVPKYLHYFLFNNHKLGLTEYYQNKTTGIRNLQLSRYLDTEIPVLPLPQQEKIVSILDTASALVEKQKALLDKYDLFLKSKFIEMFGDPVKNLMGWEVKGFLDILNLTTGKLDSNASEEGGIYPFFTCAQETFAINTYAFDCEALLLAGNNAAGVYSIKHYNGKFNAYQRTYVLTLKDSRNQYEFFKMLLETKLLELQNVSIGTNTKYLTLGILKNIQMYIPEQALQVEFSKIVRQIEILKQKELQKLEKLQTLYDALMKRAFDGEIE